MDNQRDKLWNAYLDGELPAPEAASFDQSLTPDERKRLEGELAFERGCADALRKNVTCPGDVWQRTLAALPSEAVDPTPTNVLPWYWKPVFAAAASVLIAIAYFGIRVNTEAPVFLDLAENNVKTLQAVSQLENVTLAELNAFLEDRNFDVALTPFEAGGHPMRLIGARESHFHNERVVELLFSCCDKPVKVAIVPQGGPASEAVGKALGGGVVMESQPVGSHLAVMVGRHRAPKLLSYLTDSWTIRSADTAR
jgi:hypothetical protein